jgi:hypothetical protein
MSEAEYERERRELYDDSSTGSPRRGTDRSIADRPAAAGPALVALVAMIAQDYRARQVAQTSDRAARAAPVLSITRPGAGEHFGGEAT